MSENNNTTAENKGVHSTQQAFSTRIKQLKEEKDKAAKLDGKAYGYPEMTRRFGKQEAAIRAWETGRTMPGAETLVEISKEFDCSIDYLLGISNYRVEKHVYDEAQKRLLNHLGGLGEMEPYLVGALASIFQNIHRSDNDMLKNWALALFLTLGDVSSIYSDLNGGPQYWDIDYLKVTRAFNTLYFNEHGPDMSDGRVYAYGLGKMSEYQNKSILFLKGYCLELFRMLKEDGLEHADEFMQEGDIIKIISMGREEELPGGAYEMAKERIDNPYVRLSE